MNYSIPIHSLKEGSHRSEFEDSRTEPGSPSTAYIIDRILARFKLWEKDDEAVDNPDDTSKRKELNKRDRIRRLIRFLNVLLLSNSLSLSIRASQIDEASPIGPWYPLSVFPSHPGVDISSFYELLRSTASLPLSRLGVQALHG